ncbi:MAG: DMT family transporter [Proteobacteria bacterium]|nr:DMT family transporter [Pseudomonadota bacterium]
MTSPVSAAGEQAKSNVRGIFFMLLAMASFIINDTFVKLARQDWETGQILVVRGVFALVFIAIWLALAGAFRKLPLMMRREPLMRGFLEGFIAVTFIIALGQIALTDITAIFLTTPLVITALSMLVFGEKVGWRRWGAVIAGFAGMLLVVRPGNNTIPPLALALVLSSVLAAAFRDLMTRRMPVEVPSLIVLLASIAGVMLAGLMMVAVTQVWRPMAPAQLGFMLGSAAFVVLGNFAMINATRGVELSVVMPFRYSVILWAVLLGIVVFDDWPKPLALGGIALIAASGIYTLHRERIRQAEKLKQGQPGESG